MPDNLTALADELEAVAVSLLTSDAVAPWRNLSGETAANVVAKAANYFVCAAALRARGAK